MRFRELREQFGYTQEFVAEAIDVARITYVRYESDTRNIKGRELQKLAELYSVSVDYLLGLTDIPNIYLDEQKDPPPDDQERAAAAASAGPDNVVIPGNVEALAGLVRQIVDQALAERSQPAGDQ